MTGGGISAFIGVLLLRCDRHLSSIIDSEKGTDVWLVDYTTTVITLAAIRCLTSTEEDVATWTYKATNTKPLQGFERIETNLTEATFADWLKLWDCLPPPLKTIGAAKLMEFTACL